MHKQVVIDGETYVHHLEAKSLAIRIMREALSKLELPTEAPEEPRQEIEAEPVQQTLDIGFQYTDWQFVRVVNALKASDIPTASLVQTQLKLLYVNKHGKEVWYYTTPTFAKFFMGNDQRSEARFDVLTKATKSVFGDDYIACILRANREGDTITFNHEVLTDTTLTDTQKSAYIAWKKIEKAIHAGERTNYRYVDIQKIGNLSKSTCYHALQVLKQAGHINLDKLTHARKVSDAT